MAALCPGLLTEGKSEAEVFAGYLSQKYGISPCLLYTSVLDRKKEELEREAVRTFRKLKVFADWFSPMARRVTIDEHFFFFRAPVVIVILSETKLNGALAAQNMEFAAEANGLGVLFSGFFTMAANASPKIKKALEVSKGKKVVTTLVMGRCV